LQLVEVVRDAAKNLLALRPRFGRCRVGVLIG
jgi:hypothetical protein